MLDRCSKFLLVLKLRVDSPESSEATDRPRPQRSTTRNPTASVVRPKLPGLEVTAKVSMRLQPTRMNAPTARVERQRVLYFSRIDLPSTKANSIQTMNTCLELARGGAEVVLVVRRLQCSRRDCFAYYGLPEHPRLRIVSLSLPLPSGFNDWEGPYFRFYLASLLRRYRRPGTVLFTRDPAGLDLLALVHRLAPADRHADLLRSSQARLSHQGEPSGRTRPFAPRSARARQSRSAARSRVRGVRGGRWHRVHLRECAPTPRSALPESRAGLRGPERRSHGDGGGGSRASRRRRARSRCGLCRTVVSLEGRRRPDRRHGAPAGTPA